jgi:preprotein translocase subunit SecD
VAWKRLNDTDVCEEEGKEDLMSIIDYLKEPRILAFILLLVVFAVLDLIYGIHLGLEFSGGVQIPLTLEHSASPQNMSLLISVISQRISSFGLANPTVQSEGNSQVIIQMSNASQSTIQGTIKVIESQGIFQGIVAGKEAINGTGIVGSSVAPQPLSISGSNVTWIVDFYVTEPAAVRFSKIAYGEANQPLYLFLDRPTNSIILLNESDIPAVQGATTTSEEVALEKATSLGNQTIPIQFLASNASNWASLYTIFAADRNKYDQVILGSDTPNSIIANLTMLNYTIDEKNTANMTPQMILSTTNASGLSITGTPLVDSWTAIGLLSAPLLNPGVTQGTVSQSYEISGPAPANLSFVSKTNYATNESRTISSILKGGALPIPVIVGTPTVVPPTLGKNAELISGVAAILAVLAVTTVIVVRYKRLFLIGPIILTTLGELFVIASILGIVGGIDLAAVAGMIAVVGTGVDAQIIISDELLVQHTEASTTKTKLSRAFYVVWADAALLSIAMMPLLFSTGLLTVIGFSESTLIGAILGAVITRPAYGAIISKHISKGQSNA